MLNLLVTFSFSLVLLTIANFAVFGQETNESPNELLLPISRNGKFGYIDTKGKIIIEPKFDTARNFSEGSAAIGIRKEINNNNFYVEYGYIDKKGKIIIPIQFYSAGDFKGGIAVVFESMFNTYAYIDKTGNIITRFSDKSYNTNRREQNAAHYKGWATELVFPGSFENTYPTVTELICASDPSNAEVFLIPLFDWENDENLINNDNKLAKYKVPTGNTNTSVNVKEKVYIALFIKDGKRKWVKVDIPKDKVAKVAF